MLYLLGDCYESSQQNLTLSYGVSQLGVFGSQPARIHLTSSSANASTHVAYCSAHLFTEYLHHDCLLKAARVNLAKNNLKLAHSRAARQRRR